MGMMIGLINLTNVLQNHTVYHLDQKGSRQRNKRFCFNLFFGVVSIFYLKIEVKGILTNVCKRGLHR